MNAGRLLLLHLEVMLVTTAVLSAFALCQSVWLRRVRRRRFLSRASSRYTAVAGAFRVPSVRG